ncbi:ferredoxin [archaeon]|jgi:ferredoxin|nr:ferredoxin [archaeon]MBT4021791.1 ferredoxin [archaeon]MBT4271794.1 ferredoxin [archaeon]MBT4460511.1 ferredoxin [archaeon]MBT4858531.1 ferredoxin [archaeon]
MGKIKIVYDMDGCIGAAACAAMDPKYFEMNEEGKAVLKGGEKNKEGKYELVINENDDTFQAAESCPVQVIKLIDEETGEELI